MKTLDHVVEILRKHKEDLKNKYKVKHLRILDPSAMEVLVSDEDEEREEIGIVVDFEEYPTLLGFVRLKRELEELLGVKVGLYTEGGLDSLIDSFIKRGKFMEV